MVHALDAFEEDCELDAPLKFRPFIAKAVEKLCKTLAERVSMEWLLKDIPGSEGRHDLCVFHELVFPGFPGQATALPGLAIVRSPGVLTFIVHHHHHQAGRRYSDFHDFLPINYTMISHFRWVHH
jgi:hypothetical protein